MQLLVFCCGFLQVSQILLIIALIVRNITFISIYSTLKGLERAASECALTPPACPVPHSLFPVTPSDVQARLGSKAQAWARPEWAWAFLNARPSPVPRLWLVE